MVCFSIGSADRLTLLEDFTYLWIQLNIFVPLLLDLLVPLHNSLIDPHLELVTKPGVQDVDQISSSHLNHFFVTIR